MDKDFALKLSPEYLQEILDHESRNLCGKCLKRFEIISDRQLLKADLKELIYEEFRHLRDLFFAAGGGMEMSIFDFKVKSK
jgi:hypothetical protein